MTEDEPVSIRCPACGKANTPRYTTPYSTTEQHSDLACSRCQADLSELLEIRTAAETLAQQAQRALHQGNAIQAKQLAQQSLRLKPTEEAKWICTLAEL